MHPCGTKTCTTIGISPVGQKPILNTCSAHSDFSGKKAWILAMIGECMRELKVLTKSGFPTVPILFLGGKFNHGPSQIDELEALFVARTTMLEMPYL
jgi:hypothetical protein